MSLGAVFAAILAVLAAADHARAAEPAEDPIAEAADDGAADDAAPDEATPVEPAGPLADAPAGAPLADAGPVLISRSEGAGGWAVERLVEASGDIVEHVVDRAGTVQSCRSVGSLFSLRVVEQEPAKGGEAVEVVRDASGALLRLVVAADGEPRAVALLAPPPR